MLIEKGSRTRCCEYKFAALDAEVKFARPWQCTHLTKERVKSQVKVEAVCFRPV